MRIINPLAFLLFSVSVLGVALNPNKYSGKLPKTLLHTAIPAHVVEHVVLGFKLIAADGIWIRLIQDLDYKDEYMASVRKGWAFRMADIKKVEIYLTIPNGTKKLIYTFTAQDELFNGNLIFTWNHSPGVGDSILTAMVVDKDGRESQADLRVTVR
jgi:hypothetical protein